MTLSFKSIGKRIRQLELKLKLVLTAEERVNQEDKTIFLYYLDKEEGKNPPVPENSIAPKTLFFKRAEFFKKIVDKNEILQRYFAKTEINMRKYDILQNFLKERRKLMGDCNRMIYGISS